MEKQSDVWARLMHAGPGVQLAGQICALVVIGIGAAVLAGWALDLPALKSVLQGAVEMKANTAVGLVFSGCALLFAADRRSARMAGLLALSVGTLGMGTLSQYVFGWNLHIDELLFRDTGDAYNAARGRMSPYTATSFMASGLALFAVIRMWKGLWVRAASFMIIGVAGVSLVGYLWNAREIVTDMVAPPVAVHTALALVFLGAGILAIDLATRRRVMGTSAAAHSYIESRVLTGLVGAFLILLIAAGYIYHEEAESRDSADWLQHSRMFDQTLRDLSAASSDAQSALRGYVLTQERPYREAYEARARDAEAAVATLKGLVAADAAQSTLCAELERLLQDRLGTMYRVAAAHESGNPAQVQEEIRNGRTLEGASAINAAIADIDAAEAALLDRRRADLEKSRRTTLAALLVFLVGTAWVATLLWRGVRREGAARRKTEQELEAVYKVSQHKHLELERSHALLKDQATNVQIANQFLDSVVENLPHMIFVKEAVDLRFVRLNRAGYELLGFSREDLLGKNDHDFFPKEEADLFCAHDRAVLSSGQMKDIAREVVHTKDKGQRVLHTRKIPIVGEDGEPLYLLGISEDITEAEAKQFEILRLNAELELLAAEATNANRAKSTFLATMSHEIRTPMNGMMGMLELLSLTPLDADQKVTLEVVRESSRALLRILNDILDFSKMEAGKLDIRLEGASIADLVESVYGVYAGAASSKGLLIRRRVDPRIGAALMVDPLRLRQILNNLTSNAVKFTLHGSIDIVATMVEQSQGHQTIEISVTDTGIGISPEDQKQLFEPFNQGPGITAHRFGGTGLGLSICRRLAELMGGSVLLRSDPGQGTCMTLTLCLPIASTTELVRVKIDVAPPQALPVATTQAPSVYDAEAQGVLALVVDDHPTNRVLISRQLLALGIACVLASDGNEALQVWASRKLAIIITDCHMPHMNGYDLARKIRDLESSTGRRIPIIACTANALDGVLENCLAAGMDDYLVKPIDLHDLAAKVRQWLPRGAFTHKPIVPESVAPVPSAAFDLARIAQTWGGAESALEVLSQFRGVNDKDVESLLQAANASDMLAVVHFAHRMLGAGKMVGADDFAFACGAVVAAARAPAPQSVSTAMANFERELKRLNKGLDDLIVRMAFVPHQNSREAS